MTVRTRFAPSPSGYLHIGGARTALFSWAWARKHGGEFLLRIEDTDAARSDVLHGRAIMAALEWLGMDIDGAAIFQSERRRLHLQAARHLLETGAAYRCYCSPQELRAMREAQIARGETPRYDRRCRGGKKPPSDISPAVRLKTPTDGTITCDDLIKGRFSVSNAELDDAVLLRSDGAPTYTLANVADDIDMKITHVIRGDDHALNTCRQLHVYRALGASPPQFAHAPMILSAAGEDGDGEIRYERMSKRHAAVDVMQYRRDGILPGALLNYLARLSWSHGNTEFFDSDFFTAHFDLARVQKSPARFDRDKLLWLNREHLQQLPVDKIRAMLALDGGINDGAIALSRPRARTLRELEDELAVFVRAPAVDGNLLAAHLPPDNIAAFESMRSALKNLSRWDAEAIKNIIKDSARAAGIKFPALAMPLRVMLTGKPQSADIASLMAALGAAETGRRLSRTVNFVVKRNP